MRRTRDIKRRGSKITFSVITGICLSVFLFTLATVLILNARWLYELDIRWLDLERISGMLSDDIRANYHALIDYNQVWFRGELVFPTLPMSREGAIHFQEVKRIFDVIQIACFVTGLMSLLLVIRQKQHGIRTHFRIAGILSIIIPVISGMLVAIDWERFFVTFHRIFFRNDYWLFDPVYDPVILILPDTFFLQCAAGILVIILAGAVLFLILGRTRN